MSTVYPSVIGSLEGGVKTVQPLCRHRTFLNISSILSFYQGFKECDRLSEKTAGQRFLSGSSLVTIVQ